MNIFSTSKSPSVQNKPDQLKLLDLTSSQNFYKCTKLILSRDLVFFFIEFKKRQCVMQIRNIRNDLIFATSNVIILRLFEQYQFLGYGKRILAMYYTDDAFILKLFDLNLKLLKSRTVNFRINLHSINDNEIVCFRNFKNKINTDLARYLVMDHQFNVKFTFGQCKFLIFLIFSSIFNKKFKLNDDYYRKCLQINKFLLSENTA